MLCHKLRYVALMLLVSLVNLPGLPAQQTSQKLIAELRSAPPAQRVAILKRLQGDSSLKLIEVVQAMTDADPVQKNLLLGVAQSLLDRSTKPSETELQAIIKDTGLDAAARYWAFTALSGNDAKKREAMLHGMLEDPALELRYEAVKLAQAEVVKQKDAGADAAQLKQSYRKLLVAARLPEQVQEIADKLKELEDEVDLLNHFGFIANWQVIGPFDNRKQAGFNVAYAPEVAFASSKSVDLKAQVDGKSGKVAWQAASTKEKDGAVDLNPIFKNEKGAIAYAYGEFNLAKPVNCEVRLGCINANKVWVNGELKLSNEVYHAGAQIDQYVAPVKLAAGKNTILVKLCQNEQTEPWAQDWKFQLRFTDSSGMAIRPAP